MDKNLLLEIENWGHKVDHWLRSKSYSNVKEYVHPSHKYGEPALLDIELESIEANRFIEIAIAKIEMRMNYVSLRLFEKSMEGELDIFLCFLKNYQIVNLQMKTFHFY